MFTVAALQFMLKSMPTLTLIILTKVGKNIAYDITPNKTSYVISSNGKFIYSSLVV